MLLGRCSCAHAPTYGSMRATTSGAAGRAGPPPGPLRWLGSPSATESGHFVVDFVLPEPDMRGTLDRWRSGHLLQLTPKDRDRCRDDYEFATALGEDRCAACQHRAADWV